MAELNLIPSYIKVKRHKTFVYKQYIAAAIVVFSILFFGLYFPWMKINNLKGTEKDLKNRVSSEQYLIAEQQKTQSEINVLNNYINIVGSIANHRTMVNDKIRKLEKYIPNDLVFQGLTYNDNAININGTTNNYNSVAEFVANLQLANEFSNAEIVNISFNDTDKTYNYTVSIK